MTQALTAHLETLERELLTEATRRNRNRMEALLAPEFREFGSSGRRFTREEIIAELLAEIAQPCTLDSFVLQRLSITVALVTYRTRHVVQSGGQHPAKAWRSSIWVEREGRWQIIFHQGTRAAASDS